MIEVVGATSNNYTIKQILKENWENFCRLYRGFIRETVIINVAKVLNCGNREKLGFSLYSCPVCNEKHFVNHTCKSRFCNSCGKVKNDEWINKAQTRLLNVPHKHLVFTIPSELWLLFAVNRHLQKYLFQSAAQAVMDWGETKHLMPGIVAVLHTFGAKLNFNCHIHIICTLGGFHTKNLVWKNINTIPYQPLKARFKAILLHHLREEFKNKNIIVPKYIKNDWREKFGTDVFFNVQNELYKKVWYVYVGEKLENIDFTVGYIGRYAKRPCMSEAKITYYSKEDNIIKFTYRDKITKEDIIMTLPIMTFIGLLVRHIPERYFQMIRYYGAYANARKSKILKMVCDQIVSWFGIANLLFGPPRKTWRQRMLEQNGTDPLKCPKCGLTMCLAEINYRTRDGTMKTISFF